MARTCSAQRAEGRVGSNPTLSVWGVPGTLIFQHSWDFVLYGLVVTDGDKLVTEYIIYNHIHQITFRWFSASRWFSIESCV